MSAGLGSDWTKKRNEGVHAAMMSKLILGGESTAWLNLKHDGSNFDEVKTQWMHTITDETLVPVDYSLAPIWTLLKYIDNGKATELRNYFVSKWKAEERALQQMPAAPVIVKCEWR